MLDGIAYTCWPYLAATLYAKSNELGFYKIAKKWLEKSKI